MADEPIPAKQQPEVTEAPEATDLIDVIISVPPDQLAMTQTVLASLSEAVNEAVAGAEEQTEVNDADVLAEEALLASEIEGLANNRL